MILGEQRFFLGENLSKGPRELRQEEDSLFEQQEATRTRVSRSNHIFPERDICGFAQTLLFCRNKRRDGTDSDNRTRWLRIEQHENVAD